MSNELIKDVITVIGYSEHAKDNKSAKIDFISNIENITPIKILETIDTESLKTFGPLLGIEFIDDERNYIIQIILKHLKRGNIKGIPIELTKKEKSLFEIEYFGTSDDPNKTGNCFCCNKILKYGETGDREWNYGHMISAADGGSPLLENRCLLCRKCNTNMKTKSVYEYKEILDQNKQTPSCSFSKDKALSLEALSLENEEEFEEQELEGQEFEEHQSVKKSLEIISTQFKILTATFQNFVKKYEDERLPKPQMYHFVEIGCISINILDSDLLFINISDFMINDRGVVILINYGIDAKNIKLEGISLDSCKAIFKNITNVNNDFVSFKYSYQGQNKAIVIRKSAILFFDKNDGIRYKYRDSKNMIFSTDIRGQNFVEY